MAQYKFTSNGDGLGWYIAEGIGIQGDDLLDALKFTPEPILAGPDLAALQEFLGTTHVRNDRRTNAQRQEGHRLLALVNASTADAFGHQAMEYLRKFLRGESFLPPGKPKPLPNLSGGREAMIGLAFHIKKHVEKCVREKRPLEVPIIGVVDDNPEWASLSPAEHAMCVVKSELKRFGYDAGSIPTLRNQMSQRAAKIRKFSLGSKT